MSSDDLVQNLKNALLALEVDTAMEEVAHEVHKTELEELIDQAIPSIRNFIEYQITNNPLEVVVENICQEWVLSLLNAYGLVE